MVFVHNADRALRDFFPIELLREKCMYARLVEYKNPIRLDAFVPSSLSFALLEELWDAL